MFARRQPIFIFVLCLAREVLNSAAIQPPTDELEPVTVIHVAMEEGTGDALEAARKWEDAKQENVRWVFDK